MLYCCNADIASVIKFDGNNTREVIDFVGDDNFKFGADGKTIHINAILMGIDGRAQMYNGDYVHRYVRTYVDCYIIKDNLGRLKVVSTEAFILLYKAIDVIPKSKRAGGKCKVRSELQYIQYTGNNTSELFEFGIAKVEDEDFKNNPYILIPTPTGMDRRFLSLNDFIVKTIRGTFLVFTPKDFKDTYEIVE